MRGMGERERGMEGLQILGLGHHGKRGRRPVQAQEEEEDKDEDEDKQDDGERPASFVP